MTDRTDRLDNVRKLERPTPRPAAASTTTELAGPVSNELVETIAGLLIRLRDTGREVAARSSVILVPDPDLVLAGQRVELIAERLFVAIFTEHLPR